MSASLSPKTLERLPGVDFHAKVIVELEVRLRGLDRKFNRLVRVVVECPDDLKAAVIIGPGAANPIVGLTDILAGTPERINLEEVTLARHIVEIDRHRHSGAPVPKTLI